MDFFSKLPEHLSSETAAQISHLKWEAAIVSRMLNFYGLERMGVILRHRCKEATGTGRLLFTWFHNTFPDFPVWLVFDKVRYLHLLTMEDFVARFTKTPVFDAYLTARDAVPGEWAESGRPVALVFEYIHGLGAAVITDCERPLGEDSTRIVKNYRGQNISMESFDDFLKGLGWVPSGY
jgi:hypothetical protein